MNALVKNVKPAILAFAIALGFAVSCERADAASAETAVFAGGCFWCVEADFESVNGVLDAVSGYTGGTLANPSYKQVSRGGTGHYEAVQITYDPGRVSYDDLVRLFLRSVDPTDPGGQFCDRGESYRTAIFATSEQKAMAEAGLLEAELALGRKIVTPVLAAQPFYPAEKYHQDFYRKRDVILTRFGPKSKETAYKLYRASCGRDERLRQLWGGQAAFAGK